MRAALFGAVLLAAGPAIAQEIKGTAVANDGSSVIVTDVDGKRTIARLWGVEAPDPNVWPWGTYARAAMNIVLEKHGPSVVCESKARSYDHIVAFCRAGGIDIGDAIIRAGYALDDRKISMGHYSRAELEAAKARRGLWKDYQP